MNFINIKHLGLINMLWLQQSVKFVNIFICSLNILYARTEAELRQENNIFHYVTMISETNG